MSEAIPPVTPTPEIPPVEVPTFTNPTKAFDKWDYIIYGGMALLLIMYMYRAFTYQNKAK